MVFEYYGTERSEDGLSELCGRKDGEGTEVLGLVKAAKGLGFRAEFIEGAHLEELTEWVEGKGVPVIVEWFSIFVPHYSPVVRVTAKNVWLADPDVGKIRRLSHKRFSAIWFAFDPVHSRTPESLKVGRMIAVYP
jgi:ABC-type bacteriocin/lantibiotic exporter with double-glycine peptidase domain